MNLIRMIIDGIRSITLFPAPITYEDIQREADDIEKEADRIISSEKKKA